MKFPNTPSLNHSSNTIPGSAKKFRQSNKLHDLLATPPLAFSPLPEPARYDGSQRMPYTLYKAPAKTTLLTPLTTRAKADYAEDPDDFQTVVCIFFLNFQEIFSEALRQKDADSIINAITQKFEDAKENNTAYRNHAVYQWLCSGEIQALQKRLLDYMSLGDEVSRDDPVINTLIQKFNPNYQDWCLQNLPIILFNILRVLAVTSEIFQNDSCIKPKRLQFEYVKTDSYETLQSSEPQDTSLEKENIDDLLVAIAAQFLIIEIEQNKNIQSPCPIPTLQARKPEDKVTSETSPNKRSSVTWLGLGLLCFIATTLFIASVIFTKGGAAVAAPKFFTALGSVLKVSGASTGIGTQIAVACAPVVTFFVSIAVRFHNKVKGIFSRSSTSQKTRPVNIPDDPDAPPATPNHSSIIRTQGQSPQSPRSTWDTVYSETAPTPEPKQQQKSLPPPLSIIQTP